MEYIDDYLQNSTNIIQLLDRQVLIRVIEILTEVRRKEGRLFILGVGGSAGNASHAVNDFRKIAGIETYAPSDNVSELTARINDDGWDTSYANWLSVSHVRKDDAVFIFSVGGGDAARQTSVNLIKAVEYAKTKGAKILGIVGRDGGYTAEVADACIIIPPLYSAQVTPLTESFQVLIWHLIVSHPAMQRSDTMSR
jgi:D-sedoheptulose 7-phosphate isomerase